MGENYEKYYYLTDGSGRELAFTNRSGIMWRDQLAYTNGGNQAGAIAAAEGFANARAPIEKIPTLSFYRNRYYDQTTGRFTQEDPIGIAGGVNLYQYAGNNPAVYTDPFGLDPCKPNDYLCLLARAGWQLVGGTLGLIGGAAIGGGLGSITCGPPHCTLLGAAAVALEGSIAGALVAGQVFDEFSGNVLNMARAGRAGRKSTRDALYEKYRSQYNPDPEQRGRIRYRNLGSSPNLLIIFRGRPV